MVIYSLTHCSSIARDFLAIGRHGRCIVENDETTQHPKKSIALLVNIIALKCLNFYLFTQSVPILSSMFIATTCVEFGLGLAYSFLNKDTEDRVYAVGSIIGAAWFKIEAIDKLILNNFGKVKKCSSLVFPSLLINILLIMRELIFPNSLINTSKHTKELLDSLRTANAAARASMATAQVAVERFHSLNQTTRQELTRLNGAYQEQITRLRAEIEEQGVLLRGIFYQYRLEANSLQAQNREEIENLNGIYQQPMENRVQARRQQEVANWSPMNRGGLLRFPRLNGFNAHVMTDRQANSNIQEHRTLRYSADHEESSITQSRMTALQRQIIQSIPEELERDSVFSRYTCAISMETLTDPVMDPTNHRTLYERRAILEAIRRDPRSPHTRRPLYTTQLIELPHLKALIQDRLEWYSRQNWRSRSPTELEELFTIPANQALENAAKDELERYSNVA